MSFWATSSRLWLVPVFVGLTLGLLILRHWVPLLSFWVGAALLVAYSYWFALVDVAEFGSTLALLILAFWAIVRGHSVWLVSIGALAAAAIATYRFYGVQQNMADSGQSETPILVSITETLGRLILVAMAIAAAWLTRKLLLQARELADRNRELEARRGDAARAAVIDERLRISRELHDVVAHHISTMTVHAGGAQRALTTNPDAAQSSLAQIAQSGRDAIGELQRMLGFLRGKSGAEDDTRSPAPSLRHVEWLVASYGDDLQVETATSGPVDALPASVDLSAYRIVQEALTNVAKHSGTAVAHVEIASHPSKTEVTITNPAGPSGRAGGGSLRAPEGTGHGIIGMRERAALHNGSIEIGPTEKGGWKVHAVLNHDMPAGKNGARA